jgi:hypothetical protein
MARTEAVGVRASRQLGFSREPAIPGGDRILPSSPSRTPLQACQKHPRGGDPVPSVGGLTLGRTHYLALILIT